MSRRPTYSALVFFVVAASILLPSVALADGSNTGAFRAATEKGPAIALGASFVAGFLASLTPCVFPMVPITVAIFGATESKSRSRGMALSATFVMGMAALFVPLGIGAALSG